MHIANNEGQVLILLRLSEESLLLFDPDIYTYIDDCRDSNIDQRPTLAICYC